MVVKFSLVPSPAGPALVAARGGKVVASFLPRNSAAEAVAALRERFPDAVEAPAKRVPGAAAVRRWLAGDPSGLRRVPLALGGLPPFAGRVYRELRKVPAGETVTYGELARRAGSPRGARAVGGAMAKNPLAPFVPCHRVVGHDGGLTGFSATGGLGFKAALLAAESRAAVQGVRASGT